MFFKKFLLNIYQHFFAYLIAFIALVFVLLFVSVDKMLDNDYIINNFIIQAGYSKKTLVLENNNKLINDLFVIFSQNNTNSTILPLFFVNLPQNFNNIDNINVQKTLFINIMLPLILTAEQEILTDRQELLNIVNKLVYIPLDENDLYKIKVLAKKYKVASSNITLWDYSVIIENLLLRIDILPRSLVLAMAIKESGWGTSNFTIKSNALFAQWVYNDRLGHIPKERLPNQKHSILVFNSLLESVRGYYLNINTNIAYNNLRELRVRSRLSNYMDGLVLDSYTDAIFNNLDNNFTNSTVLNPFTLAHTLFVYSGQDEDYTYDLIRIIRSNNLTMYDEPIKFNSKHNKLILKVK